MNDFVYGLLHSTKNIYWKLAGGSQDFSLDGITARFEAPPDCGGDIIRWTYDIEKEWLKNLLNRVQKDDIVFDVGANIGFYACFLSEKLEDGTVFAFEPFQPNIHQLKSNLQMNADNSEVHEVALSNENGVTSFSDPNVDRTGHPTGTISTGQNGNGKVEIETIRGDHLVQNGVPQPDVVKIDVEGSEPLVMDGLKKTLSDEQCRLVFLEIHLPSEGRPSIQDFGSSSDELQDQLKSLGFTLQHVDRRNDELHVVGEKK